MRNVAVTFFFFLHWKAKSKCRGETDYHMGSHKMSKDNNNITTKQQLKPTAPSLSTSSAGYLPCVGSLDPCECSVGKIQIFFPLYRWGHWGTQDKAAKFVEVVPQVQEDILYLASGECHKAIRGVWVWVPLPVLYRWVKLTGNWIRSPVDQMSCMIPASVCLAEQWEITWLCPWDLMWTPTDWRWIWKRQDKGQRSKKLSRDKDLHRWRCQ